MKIGIIGVGVVGGTLKKFIEINYKHEIACYDPGRGLYNDLTGCEAIFISVPVKSCSYGQDLKILTESVLRAKKITDKIFIRSTVLPGTNDSFGTISMPEFLTERRALEDMEKLPMIFGSVDKEFVDKIFPGKKKIIASNIDAEISKYTHNCFGAIKVTYFNMIKKLCDSKNSNFENVKYLSNITGFIGNEHSNVPGHDGKLGYAGKCFPENMESLETFFSIEDKSEEANFIKTVRNLNSKYRGEKI